ncbi:MAG: hypothetical protein DWH80_11275 [Planctomycetota bacterium]|nr:MAG: hypothetical protein DWH80_11275 [Planctomycetota bacterium]
MAQEAIGRTLLYIARLGIQKNTTLFGVPFADYEESCRRGLPVWHVDGKADTKFYFSGLEVV